MATRTFAPVIRYLHQITAPSLSALSDGQLLARFAAGRDESAFTALVRRHGPMVYNLCRRVLRDGHAAEDAFQATFLVLARKASRLRQPEALAPWLYGVAYRTAVRARVEAARRRERERQATVKEAVGPAQEPVWRDLRSVLDEEVSRLPTRYQAPVVLCYLAGQTNAEAARQLGCSRGTIATRLARARERLRRRLTRRGLALSAGLGALLADKSQSAGLPAALEFSTARAASMFAAGNTQAGTLSVRAVSLAEGVAKAMLMKKLKVLVAVVVTVVLAGAGASIVQRDAGRGELAVARADEAPKALVQPGEVAAPPVAPPEDDVQFAMRTANFEIKAPTPEIARKVIVAAEHHRKMLARLWLGTEMPAWSEPCQIDVKITTKGVGSSTSFSFDHGKARVHNMILEGSLDQILSDLLPHEVTHTVLASGRGAPLPRWADEGAALMAESASSRARYVAALHKILDEKRALALRRLLPLREYPKDVKALYAQGYALTDFLVAMNGRQVFLTFIAQGERDGWDEAAQAHYGFPTVGDLERAWLLHVRKLRPEIAPVPTGVRHPVPVVVAKTPGYVLPLSEPSVEAGVEPSRTKALRHLAAGPAPTQALVALRPKGRLMVWKSEMVYEATTQSDGLRRRVTTYQLFKTLTEATYSLDEVRVYDTRGNTVDRKELPRLLKGETLALVAFGDSTAQPVDLLHLRLIKDGTLLFVLPPPIVSPLAPTATQAPIPPTDAPPTAPEPPHIAPAPPLKHSEDDPPTGR